jgi:hypothetical protein
MVRWLEGKSSVLLFIPKTPDCAWKIQSITRLTPKSTFRAKYSLSWLSCEYWWSDLS